MEQQTKLEYLINLRAISYSSNCWFYLSQRQKLIFLSIMFAMDFYEEEGKKSIPISTLIDDVKEQIEKQSDHCGEKIHNKMKGKYSKDSIRSVIYSCFPIFLNVRHYGQVKEIKLTNEARKFIDWVSLEPISKKTGKKRYHTRMWLKHDIKIKFREHTPPQK